MGCGLRFCSRCGDILFGNGTGGESIYGKKFKDDQKGMMRSVPSAMYVVCFQCARWSLLDLSAKKGDFVILNIVTQG